ncbi:MAG: N-formylglutamate amidohydrolase [Pseudomonadota bacterium]
MSASAAIPPLTSLLSPGEPPAVTVVKPEGTSDFVLVCDHASNAIPRSLDHLGLSENELASHIAWDIGAAGVALQLAERLDAILVLQNYSRLVIDCNRPLHADDSISTSSEWTTIGANENLTEAAIASRVSTVFQPYHAQLQQILDQRKREGRASLLIALHSFTPNYRGAARPWEISIMYHRDARLAKTLLKLLARDKRLVVGDNEPYSVSDESDYTIPVHGEARGIAHVGIEIRQDLIADKVSQATWAGRLSSLLQQAAKEMAGT